MTVSTGEQFLPLLLLTDVLVGNSKLASAAVDAVTLWRLPFMPSFGSSWRRQFLPFTKYGPLACLLLCQSSPTSIFSHSSTLLSFCFLCPFPYLVIGLSSIAKHVNVSHTPRLPMFCCHSFCADRPALSQNWSHHAFAL